MTEKDDVQADGKGRATSDDENARRKLLHDLLQLGYSRSLAKTFVNVPNYRHAKALLRSRLAGLSSEAEGAQNRSSAIRQLYLYPAGHKSAGMFISLTCSMNAR